MAGNIASSLLVACFTGDTRLVVPEGLKRIDAFREGDLVGSRGEHEPNGPLEWKRVLRVFQRLAPIVELQVAGRILRTTLEHPFRPVEGGWTPAGELELGQLLVTLQGAGVPVESLRATGEMATVYNLEVEDHHTYFVSGDDWGFAVWAHNAKYAPSAEHMAEAVALGKEGELAAGITGRKRGVVGPLSGKMRFADEHTATLLKKSKNVARQGWTAQLKDYAAIAKKEGISFELWVRESTKLSKPLQAAREAGEVIIRYLPGL